MEKKTYVTTKTFFMDEEKHSIISDNHTSGLNKNDILGQVNQHLLRSLSPDRDDMILAALNPNSKNPDRDGMIKVN
ncbi:MAG: hypothetical protein LAT68_12495 [Cyclobacteriaceae bacterium]|nr:hypothetical protein [Cyclobacteriaceae bacterium]MCH8517137.1 hypothetical protein [Cyclobacteriaceae bacterium]